MFKKENRLQPERAITFGSWKFTLDSGKLSLCPSMRQLLELSAHTNISLQQIFRLLTLGERYKIVRSFYNGLATGRMIDIQLNIKTSIGSIRQLRISGAIYQRRWGKADKVIGVCEDVSRNFFIEQLSLEMVEHELRRPVSIIKLTLQQLIGSTVFMNRLALKKMLNHVDYNVDCLDNLLSIYHSAKFSFPTRDRHTEFDFGALVEAVLLEIRPIFVNYKFVSHFKHHLVVSADKLKVIKILFDHLVNAADTTPEFSTLIVQGELVGQEVKVCIKEFVDEKKTEAAKIKSVVKTHACPKVLSTSNNSKSLLISSIDGITTYKEILGRWNSYFSLPVSNPHHFS